MPGSEQTTLGDRSTRQVRDQRDAGAPAFLAAPGGQPVLRVRLARPQHPTLTRRASLCGEQRAAAKAVHVPVDDLLDRGRYRVTARGAGLSASETVTVTKDRTSTVRLRLSSGRG